jgi:hypothetical protein
MVAALRLDVRYGGMAIIQEDGVLYVCRWLCLAYIAQMFTTVAITAFPFSKADSSQRALWLEICIALLPNGVESSSP